MNEKVKWYQCKRDISITVLILLLFAIVILKFDIYEYPENIWKSRNWPYPNIIIGIFWGWGMWLPTLAVLIEAIFICIKHYWSWLVITFFGVSFYLTIYSLNNVEGTLKITDILINEFSDMHSIIFFMQGVYAYVLLSSPYVAITSVLVYFIRKKHGHKKEDIN